MLIPGKKLTVFSIKSSDRRGAVWVRIGTAFVNKDESLNVWLDALPIDGKLHCRESVAERQAPAGPPPDDSVAAPAMAAAGGAQ
ncbi:MAG TPA: hypothetical protein VFA20_20740 [Myxococcaceae bacterium]|nr:hypothetical protein [Myxococcaceae bacterium]